MLIRQLLVPLYCLSIYLSIYIGGLGEIMLNEVGFGAAVCCAERGMRAHLLLRGEQPAVPTGYNLLSLMYGSVSYVPRSVYANRKEMLMKHAELVAGDLVNVVWADYILNLENDELSLNDNGTPLWKDGNVRRVVIVNEGAGSVAALLGRLILS